MTTMLQERKMVALILLVRQMATLIGLGKQTVALIPLAMEMATLTAKSIEIVLPELTEQEKLKLMFQHGLSF